MTKSPTPDLIGTARQALAELAELRASTAGEPGYISVTLAHELPSGKLHTLTLTSSTIDLADAELEEEEVD